MNQYAHTTGHAMSNAPAANPAHAQQAAYSFTLDEAAAEQAGVLPYITKTGPVIATIQRATYRRNGTGSHAMVIFFIDPDGQEGRVTLTYLKNDGRSPAFGSNFINAILYLVGLPGFTWQFVGQGADQEQIAPELTGKTVGLFVQKTKNQNDDGTHLELKHAFDPASRMTVTEIKNNKPAETIDKLMKALGIQ